jgi:hypothetical protein
MILHDSGCTLFFLEGPAGNEGIYPLQKSLRAGRQEIKNMIKRELFNNWS